MCSIEASHSVWCSILITSCCQWQLLLCETGEAHLRSSYFKINSPALTVLQKQEEPMKKTSFQFKYIKSIFFAQFHVQQIQTQRVQPPILAKSGRGNGRDSRGGVKTCPQTNGTASVKEMFFM